MDIQDFTNPDLMTRPRERRHSHPLDPLSADEIRLARSIVRQLPELSGDTRFPAIRLFEPPKQIVRDFRAEQSFERRAWVVAHDFSANGLYDGVVSLDRHEVLEWNARPGLQGPLLLEEYDAAIELIKLDPRWQGAIGRRGIDDLDNVRVDAWMLGNFGIPEQEGRRMCASLAYLREQNPAISLTPGRSKASLPTWISTREKSLRSWTSIPLRSPPILAGTIPTLSARSEEICGR